MQYEGDLYECSCKNRKNAKKEFKFSHQFDWAIIAILGFDHIQIFLYNNYQLVLYNFFILSSSNVCKQAVQMSGSVYVRQKWLEVL